jgi:cytochrome P450
MSADAATEIFQMYESVARAGRREPVQHVPSAGVWLVHSHRDVTAMLSNHEVFSSEVRHSTRRLPQHDSPLLHSMWSTDPPRHRELRAVVSKLFSPRAMEALTRKVVDTVGELLAEVDPAAGVLDVIPRLADPLPIIVISELLGIRRDMLPDFVRWSRAITSYDVGSADDGVRRAEFERALAEWGAYIHEEVARHRDDGRPDVIGSLLADGGVTEQELVNICALVLTAGYDPAKDGLVHSLLCLTRFPETLDEIRADRALLPGMIEEALRLLPPVGGGNRYTAVDTVIGGMAIEAGQWVVAVTASANRDERVFADPFRFDIRRDPNNHLSFGRGIHYCLGSHLARLQLRAALGALLDLLPGRWHLPPELMKTEQDMHGVDVLEMGLTWDG